jgi:outer membrane receptor protein involved in Fe transport
MRTLPALARSTAFAAASTLSAFGQAVIPADEETVQLSPFEVTSSRDYGYRATNSLTATRTATPVVNIPLNIAVLTEEFIGDIDSTNLNDALEYISSVQTSALGNNGRIGGSSDGTRIRGFEIPFQLRNGFRRDRNVTVRNIERIEVVKGPVSQLFGQATPGGLINYITKKPALKNAASAKVGLGSYSYTYAELDGEMAFNLLRQRGAKDLAVRVLAAREDQDLYRDFEFKEEDYLVGQLAWRPTQRLQIFFEHEYIDSKSNLGQGLPRTSAGWQAAWRQAVASGNTADADRWYNSIGNYVNDVHARTGVRPPNIDSFSRAAYPAGQFDTYNLSGEDTRFNARSNSSTLEAEWKAADWLDVRYGANRYDVHYFELFMFTDVVSADDTLNVTGFASRNNDKIITTQQLDVVASHDLDWVKNKFVVGYEWLEDYETVRRLAFDATQMMQRQNIQRATVPAGQTLRDPFSNAAFFYDPRTMPGLRIAQAITSFDRLQNKQIVTLERVGYYASYRAALFDDRFNLMAGVRREEADTKVFAPVNNTTSTDTQKRTTPMAGVNFRVIPGVMLFAGYSESFVPSAARTAGGPLARLDEIQPLGPQIGKGYEAGVKLDPADGKITGTLSLFQIELSNQPSLDAERTNNDPRNADPSVPSGVRFPYDVSFFTGGGTNVVEGVDVDVVYSPLPNLQFLGSLAHTWKAEMESQPPIQGTGRLANGATVRFPDIDVAGTRLERVPEWSTSLWAKYTFTSGPLKNFSVGLGAQYKSSFRIFGGNNNGGYDLRNFTSDSYYLFDATLGYQTQVFGRRTSFIFSAKNLFDEEYIAGTYTFGEPFRVQASAKIEF